MKYGELKTEKQYLKKLAADCVNRIGDSIDAIAFSWMVYVLTGSAALTATTFAVNTLVSVVLSPFSAALITNWNKKTIIVLCDVGRGALVALTALLFFTQALRPWMVIAVTALNSALEAFRLPAGTSIFPQIVEKEKYTLAMSLTGSLTRAAELVGMGLAGVIVGALGVTWALIIDGSAFFLSALILTTLRLKPHIRQEAQNALREFWVNTKEGFAYVKDDKLVLAVCGVACFLNFSVMPLFALQTAYVNEALKLGAQAMSVMGASIMLGMSAGSLFVPKLLERMARFRLLFVGSLAAGICYCAVAFVPLAPPIWIWGALSLSLLGWGVFGSLVGTVSHIAFMEKIDEKYLARASGIMTSMCMAAMPLASFLAAALAKLVAVPYIILIFGVISVSGALCILFVKPLRSL